MTGFLFGARSDAQLYVHGCAVSSSESHDKLKDELERITHCLPGGEIICSTVVLLQF